MNSTNVSSSKTSKKEVKLDIRVVGGPLSIVAEKNNEYAIKMNPEYLIDYSTPMMDLTKSVGTYTGYIDENGKIVKRVDNKTGKEFNLDVESIKKAMKKDSKEVTIVAIDDKKIKKAKQQLSNTSKTR